MKKFVKVENNQIKKMLFALRYSGILLIALTVSYSSAWSQHEALGCSTNALNPDRIEKVMPMRPANSNKANKPINRTITVYFHVIYNNSGSNPTNEAVLVDQIKLLNAAFRNKFIFSKAPAKYYVDDALFKVHPGKWEIPNFFDPKEEWEEVYTPSAKELELKKKYAVRGDATTLNVYILDLYENSTFSKNTGGQATFPWVLSHHPNYVDGILLYYGALKGQKNSNNEVNEGDTLVHEVGHWLGLFHVFQSHSIYGDNSDGCNGAGDYVADTPAQKDAGPFAGKCPTKLDKAPDSCPQSGLDPIKNYMNYTSDLCVSEFTDGQIQRMIDKWEVYRAPERFVGEPIPMPKGTISFFADFGPPGKRDLSRPRAFQFIKPGEDGRSSIGINEDRKFITSWHAPEGLISNKNTKTLSFVYTPEELPEGMSTVLLSGPGFSSTEGNKPFYGSLRVLVSSQTARRITVKNQLQGEWLKCSILKNGDNVKACCSRNNKQCSPL